MPLGFINEAIIELKNLGVRNCLIPCNTAHAFVDQYLKFEKMHFINMVEETKRYVEKKYPDKKFMIIGTNGTACSKIYGDYQDNPEASFQQEIMELITRIKNKGSLDYCRNKLNDILLALNARNNNCLFIIACTELSIAINDYNNNNFNYVDALDVLAVKAIKSCGYKVNTKGRG